MELKTESKWPRSQWQKRQTTHRLLWVTNEDHEELRKLSEKMDLPLWAVVKKLLQVSPEIL